ncbi:baeRF2 domain-containing protein [Saccharopolyspora rosea]|uniref:Peptide chain release factor 1 n=1 Tax=Saccharopolyspora rosea TaxID=524884 RepID=A0ABW3FZY3_9PSEU|nr:hypothetical protein [Saccharopolyspora rosea]
MRLDFLRPAYRRPGPVSTVYLDTSAAEDAAKAVELRWRAARDRLVEQGADAASLDAIEAALRGHRRQIGRRGQVLVAAGGEVVFTDELPAPPHDLPAAEQVRCGPVPHLMPYLARREPRVPHVVAVVDHVGADLTTVPAGGPPHSESVEGEEHPVHKAHAGKPENQQRHHLAVEERWKRNAGAVAAALGHRADQVRAELVVLAGDVQQRRLVRAELGKHLRDKVVEAESGHRERGSSTDRLCEEVDDAVRAIAAARAAEAVAQFEELRGRRGGAAEGWRGVVAALQRDQVRLVLRTGPAGDAELAIGPRPAEIAFDERALRDLGIEPLGRVPADAAVLRALVGDNAELVLADPSSVAVTDGVGAVLRTAETDVRS